MDRESDWMVVPSRSVRSDLKGIREKERGVASRRDDRGRTTAQLGAGGDKIGQPIRLYPDRAARQTLHIPPAADSGVRGVLVVPATATAQVRRRERVREKEAVRRLELESELEWPSISEPLGPMSSEEAESPWSAVVRRPAPIAVNQVIPHPSQPSPRLWGLPVEEIDREDANGGREGGKTANGGREEKKGRKKAKQEPRQPLMLEFGSMLEALKGGKGSGRVVLGSGVPLPPRGGTAPGKREVQKPVNALDSSAPSMRRGKEREGPKKRKASALRKVIEKEKTERLQAASGHSGGGDSPRPRPAGLEVAPPHSKKFREYCCHLPSEGINETTQQLLADLVRFQDRQFQKDPVKSKAKRRYVCGLREVKKHLELKKIKCVIVAPNLDRIHSPGGIDDIVGGVLSQCREQSVPTVFALSRRRLGYVMRKTHKVGCVGIFSYDGAEGRFRKLMELVSEAQEQYEVTVTRPGHEVDSSPVDSECEADHVPSSPWDIFPPPASAPETLAADSGALTQASSSERFKLNALAPTFVPKSCLFDAQF